MHVQYYPKGLGRWGMNFFSNLMPGWLSIPMPKTIPQKIILLRYSYTEDNPFTILKNEDKEFPLEIYKGP